MMFGGRQTEDRTKKVPDVNNRSNPTPDIGGIE